VNARSSLLEAARAAHQDAKERLLDTVMRDSDSQPDAERKRRYGA